MPIHFQNYTVIKECKGNQANKIYIVEEKESKLIMILKLIKIYDLDKQLREIEVHKRLNYKFVIKMIDYDINKTHIVLLIEHAKYGDLFSILPKLKEIPESKLLKFYFQFLKAMHYLHGQGFVHRDIKPENILITRKFSPRLADFGTSAQTDFVKNTFCGTYEYMAPEIYQRLKQTEKVDIWAMGILLYEMTHQFTPFKKKSVPEIKKMLDEHKIEFKPDLNPLIKNFILRILKFNPAERPSTSELLADPLFVEFTKKHTPGYFVDEELSPKRLTNQDETEAFAEMPKEPVFENTILNKNTPDYSSVYISPKPIEMKTLNCQVNQLKSPIFQKSKQDNLAKDDLTMHGQKDHADKKDIHQSNLESTIKSSYKDLITNKEVVSSLNKIKSMFDEHREGDSKTLFNKNAKNNIHNDPKSSNGLKSQPPNTNSMQTGTSSLTIFKNLFSKLIKSPIGQMDPKSSNKEINEQLKSTLANSSSKKPFVSLSNLDINSKHLSHLMYKKPLVGVADKQDGVLNYENVQAKKKAFSIEELY
jgi:serine/threonine protein kinase